MARNVTREHPLVDPAAIWAAVPLELPAESPTDVVPPVLDGMIDPDAPEFQAAPPAPGTPSQPPDSLPIPGVFLSATSPSREMGALAGAVCSNGHALFHGAKFCPECGQPAGVLAEPSDWVCPGGHENTASVKFCPECGVPRPDLRAPVSGAGIAVELASQASVRPDRELSPAERAERERLHLEATRMGSEMPALMYEQPRTRDTKLIHFLEDGLTAFGQVWFRGQEIELDVGSERWQQAQSWINMTDFQQVDRFGKIMFRNGPWPGRRYVDGAGQFEQLAVLDREAAKKGARVAGPPPEVLAQADMQEKRRARGVPPPRLR